MPEPTPPDHEGPTRRPARRVAPAAIATSLLLVAVGCTSFVSALGPSPSAARRAGDELFHAFAARFTNVQRDAKTQVARGRLARGALTPSRVFGDTSIWTSGETSARTLVMTGRLANSRYLFEARAVAAVPDELAESRHVIRLRQLDETDWSWETRVEHAIGRMRAADASSSLSAFLGAADGRDARTLRVGSRLAFPRTTAALGRLYSLDSLRTVQDRDGATTVRLVASMHPERLRAAFPHFARYLDRYSMPARGTIALVDHSGARWLEASTDEGVVRLRARTREGRLVPLSGAPRAIPDTLQLHVDMQTRIMVFDVGFDDLVADVVLVRRPDERGVELRFAHEPAWRLPPMMGHLVRSPLRRPFAEGGATMAVSVRDGAPGAQTLLVRESRVVVRESAIVRWLNTLSGTAMSEFAGPAEVEQNRFTAELFGALQADVRALISEPARGDADR